MINEINDDVIYDGIPDYGILLVQMNCMGQASGGLPQRLARKYPEWFQDYRRQCGWFQDGHQRELMDSFYSYRVSDEVIIASVFAQYDIQKKQQTTEYAAWQKVLHRIERQVSRQKMQDGKPWTVHIQYGTGCGVNGGGDWDRMMEFIRYNFENSDVEFVIHGQARRV